MNDMYSMRYNVGLYTVHLTLIIYLVTLNHDVY